MLDINKALHDGQFLGHDPEGNLYGLPPWSRAIAQQLARDEGLGELTEMQWRVIHALRAQYRKHGRGESARQLMRTLEKDYLEEDGARHLYLLFPKGPISQGSRLAGVPAPPNSSDISFGWAG